MPLKLTKKATATVTKEQKDKGKVVAEEVVEETVDLPKETKLAEAAPLKPYCEVGVEASYTHNLGDYKSARVAVSLKVPCLHPEIDGVFDYAKQWVDGKLNAMIEELTAE